MEVHTNLDTWFIILLVGLYEDTNIQTEFHQWASWNVHTLEKWQLTYWEQYNVSTLCRQLLLKYLKAYGHI